MPAVIVNPKQIKSFASQAAFERWLRVHHDSESELWVRIYKKGSGVASVTHAEAIDSVLCWGWIDGLRKAYDEKSFLQRFSPRKPRSIWSKINREHVARLTAAGRMTPHGQKHVDAAKADGRWHAAYAPQREVSYDNLPQDLRAAIEASPRARKRSSTLPRRDLFALGFRTNNMKTAAGRAKKIAELVAKLERGEGIAQEPMTRSKAKR